MNKYYHNPLYCNHFIEGKNNSSQYYYIQNGCYYKVNNNPFYYNLPDHLSKLNYNCLTNREKIIYNNSTDKNWNAQSKNRDLWYKQNKIYHSNDMLLKDKIEKIQYEETKRINKKLKDSTNMNLRNGYFSYGNKTDNFNPIKTCGKFPIKLYGNFGINTDVYTGDTYKIKIENIDTNPIYYSQNSIKKGGNNLDNINWYLDKINYQSINYFHNNTTRYSKK